MSAGIATNAAAKADSKSARKKKTKAESKVELSPRGSSPNTPSDPTGSVDGQGPEVASNGLESHSDSPYIKEIQKNIRNINKKLSAHQKVDSIIAENPNQSLDELVAARKINQDQKAQALKKPALQSTLTQLEEQLAQYKVFEQEAQQRHAAEKELLRSAHKEELGQLKTTLRAEAEAEGQKEAKERLLTFSKFLRAAAARRQLEDSESEESKAFEGALLLVYGGDANAVVAAENIIEGKDEGVPSTEGAILSVTYAQIKESCLAYSPLAGEETWTEEAGQIETVPAPPAATSDHADALHETTVTSAATEREPTAILTEPDPTKVHETPIEIQNETAQVDSNAQEPQSTAAPEQASIGAGSGNAAAEEHWDTKSPDATNALSDSWVSVVPRDPAETETTHTPTANNSTQSWADEGPEPTPPAAQPVVAAVKDTGDGFHEVVEGGAVGAEAGFEVNIVVNIVAGVETDIVETDIVETDIVETDIVETDIVETDIVETDIVETDIVETDTVEMDIVEMDTVGVAGADREAQGHRKPLTETRRNFNKDKKFVIVNQWPIRLASGAGRDVDVDVEG